MNVVFLSPHFPPQYYRFCRQLKQAGAAVLGIADTAYDALAPEVREALTEYYRVDGMHDYDALVRACGYFTHKYGKIDRFDSLNEYWLGVEARIRDDFNISGIRSSGIDAIRRKSKMKEVFRSAGVSVARGRIVRTVGEAQALIAETGFPVVAKPDIGVGALDTFRIDNQDHLTAFFSSKPAVDYIMEEFIDAPICTFDGLIDRDGRLIFHTSHAYSQGIMETVNQGRHVSYYSLREIPEALEELGRRCVQAFGVKERFFHFEFFQKTMGAYIALEVNMRPPGGYTTDMFNYACDIDIYHTWARLLINGQVRLDYTRAFHCCYASRKHTYAYKHSHEEIISRYGDYLVEVVQVPGVFSSALGDIGYIFRSPWLDEIQTITAYIQATEG